MVLKKKIHTGAEAARRQLINTGTHLQIKRSATFQIKGQWYKANKTGEQEDTDPVEQLSEGQQFEHLVSSQTKLLSYKMKLLFQNLDFKPL